MVAAYIAIRAGERAFDQADPHLVIADTAGEPSCWPFPPTKTGGAGSRGQAADPARVHSLDDFCLQAVVHLSIAAGEFRRVATCENLDLRMSISGLESNATREAAGGLNGHRAAFVLDHRTVAAFISECKKMGVHDRISAISPPTPKPTPAPKPVHEPEPGSDPDVLPPGVPEPEPDDVPVPMPQPDPIPV